MTVQRTSRGGTQWDRATTTITFDGTAGLGAVGTPVPVFTVTGLVIVRYMIGYCVAGLTEALATATIALGIAGATTIIISTTNSVDIDTDELWVDTTPDTGYVQMPSSAADFALSADVIITPGTQNTNGGTLRIDALYIPLSSDGLIVAT